MNYDAAELYRLLTPERIMRYHVWRTETTLRIMYERVQSGEASLPGSHRIPSRPRPPFAAPFCTCRCACACCQLRAPALLPVLLRAGRLNCVLPGTSHPVLTEHVPLCVSLPAARLPFRPHDCTAGCGIFLPTRVLPFRP